MNEWQNQRTELRHVPAERLEGVVVLLADALTVLSEDGTVGSDPDGKEEQTEHQNADGWPVLSRRKVVREKERGWESRKEEKAGPPIPSTIPGPPFRIYENEPTEKQAARSIKILYDRGKSISLREHEEKAGSKKCDAFPKREELRQHPQYDGVAKSGESRVRQDRPGACVSLVA